MYKLNEETMFYDMADGQAIVINFTTGIYYGSSSLGSAVLDALVGGTEESSILTAIQTLPECPADMADQFAAFLARLTELGILLKADGAGHDAAPLAPTALQDGFLLEVNEFAEVQDLILADPVHEVDVEKGWPVLREE